MLALTAAATAHLAQRGVPPVVAGTAALAIGALLGSINGVMVAAVRTNPFVTTLSTLLIFRGAAFIIAWRKLLRRRVPRLVIPSRRNMYYPCKVEKARLVGGPIGQNY